MPDAFALLSYGEILGIFYSIYGGLGAFNMFRRPIGWILLIYIIIGIVVAWSRGYLHLWILKAIASALLAIVFWWLALLGINLHIH